MIEDVKIFIDDTKDHNYITRFIMLLLRSPADIISIHVLDVFFKNFIKGSGKEMVRNSIVL